MRFNYNYMQENKGDKFKRLASARTNEVLKKLKILSNCSNKSVYSYSTEEIEKIFSTIEKAAFKAKSQFKTKKRKEDSFKL